MESEKQKRVNVETIDVITRCTLRGRCAFITCFLRVFFFLVKTATFSYSGRNRENR